MTSRLPRIRDFPDGLAAQRQRALRVAALAFMAGLLLYLDRPGAVRGLPVPIFTGLLYAAFVTPAAVATALWLPGLTALSDAVQWARLGFAAAVAAFPAALRPWADQPLISATVVILGGMAIVTLSRRRKRPATVSA
jgi:hypothetical protein